MFNKIMISSLLFVLVGCASSATVSQPIVATPETSSRDLNLPSEEEVLSADREVSRQEGINQEEEIYDESIAKINATFNKEYQQFRTCLAVAGKRETCFQQLKQSC